MTTSTAQLAARRVTIHRVDERTWRYRVQRGNWSTLAAGQLGARRRSTVEQIAARKWPGVEIVVVEA